MVTACESRSARFSQKQRAMPRPTRARLTTFMDETLKKGISTGLLSQRETVV